MIRINLLPEEFRRAEGTPMPRLIAIVASVAVAFSMMLACGYVFLRKLPEANEKAKEAATTLATRKKQLADSGYEELLATIDALGMRKKAIGDIYRSRVEWAQKLDELVDLVPEDIGLVRVNLSEPDKIRGSRSDMHGGILTLECLSTGTDLEHYSNFVATIQGSTVEHPSPEMRLTRHRARGPAPPDRGSLSSMIAKLAGAPSAERVDPEGAGAHGHFFDDFMGLRDLGWVVQQEKKFLPALQFTLELVLKPRASDQVVTQSGRRR